MSPTSYRTAPPRDRTPHDEDRRVCGGTFNLPHLSSARRDVLPWTDGNGARPFHRRRAIGAARSRTTATGSQVSADSPHLAVTRDRMAVARDRVAVARVRLATSWSQTAASPFQPAMAWSPLAMPPFPLEITSFRLATRPSHMAMPAARMATTTSRVVAPLLSNGNGGVRAGNHVETARIYRAGHLNLRIGGQNLVSRPRKSTDAGPKCAIARRTTFTRVVFAQRAPPSAGQSSE